MNEYFANDELLREIVKLIEQRTSNTKPLVLIHIMDADAMFLDGTKASGLAIVLSNMHPDLIEHLMKTGEQIQQARRDVARENKT